MSKKGKSILVVEDDQDLLDTLSQFLGQKGFEVSPVPDAEQAIEKLKANSYDLLITDLKLPGIDGIDLIPRCKEISPRTDIMVMSGVGNIETAIDCIRRGAVRYITKPLNPEQVFYTVQIVLALRKLREKQLAADREEPKEYSMFGLIGKSISMQKNYEVIRTIAPLDVPVLITGESGTGKELVARAIHNSSPRKTNKFVAVNCGALSETLLLSELFGHVKGAFTGAIAHKTGLFQEADGGTIFLDEIGEASPALQVSLLRVLEERVFRPIGSTEITATNFRIITATNKPLADKIAEGLFRPDLFYRLNVVYITIPPLRERREDIPILVHHFIRETAERQGKGVTGISSEALSMLMGFDWPGNVRELENAIESSVAFCRGELIRVEHLPRKLREKVLPRTPGAAREDVSTLEEARKLAEIEAIRRALEKTGWNKKEASSLLRIDTATLWRKIKAFGIENPG